MQAIEVDGPYVRKCIADSRYGIADRHPVCREQVGAVLQCIIIIPTRFGPGIIAKRERPIPGPEVKSGSNRIAARRPDVYYWWYCVCYVYRARDQDESGLSNVPDWSAQRPSSAGESVGGVTASIPTKDMHALLRWEAGDTVISPKAIQLIAD